MTHFQLGNSCFRTPQATSAEAVELQTRHFRGRCSRYQSLCLLHYILDRSSINIQNCFLPWKQESCWFWTCLSQSSLILPPVTSAFTSSKSAHQTARVRLALMNNSSSSSSFPVCEPDSLNKLTDNAVMFSFRVLSSFCLPLTEFCCKVLICSFFPFFLWLVTQEESSTPDIFHYKIPKINMKCLPTSPRTAESVFSLYCQEDWDFEELCCIWNENEGSQVAISITRMFPTVGSNLKLWISPASLSEESSCSNQSAHTPTKQKSNGEHNQQSTASPTVRHIHQHTVYT